MTPEDKATIRKFAAGDKTFREAAIAAYRRAISTDGVRGTLEQDYMAEVDHPCPDLALRVPLPCASVGDFFLRRFEWI